MLIFASILLLLSMAPVSVEAMIQVKPKQKKTVRFAMSVKPRIFDRDAIDSLECPAPFIQDFVTACLRDPVYKKMVKHASNQENSEQVLWAADKFLENFALATYEPTRQLVFTVDAELRKSASSRFMHFLKSIYSQDARILLEIKYRQKNMVFMGQVIDKVVQETACSLDGVDGSEGVITLMAIIGQTVRTNVKIQTQLLRIAEDLHRSRAERIARGLARHKKSLASSLAFVAVAACTVIARA